MPLDLEPVESTTLDLEPIGESGGLDLEPIPTSPPSLTPSLPPPGQMETFTTPDRVDEALRISNQHPDTYRIPESYQPASPYTPEQQQRLESGNISENLLAGIPGLEITQTKTADELVNRFPWMDTRSAQDIAGALKTGASVWNSLVSPVGIAAGELTALAPGSLLAKAALGTFSVEAARQVGPSIGRYLEAKKSGDEQGMAEALTGLAVTTATALGAGKGAFGELRPNVSGFDKAIEHLDNAPESVRSVKEPLSPIQPENVAPAPSEPPKTPKEIAKDRLESWIKSKASEYERSEPDIDHALKRVSEDIRNNNAPKEITDIAFEVLKPTRDLETGETLDQTHPDWPRTGTLINFLESQNIDRMPQDVGLPKTASESVNDKLAIVPPMVGEVDIAIRNTATRLDQIRQGFQNAIESADTKADLVRKFDAADNEAKIEGEQVSNSIRLNLPKKLDREAVTFIVEAGGDPAKLDAFAEQVMGKGTRAFSIINHAKANWDRLSPIAEKVGQIHDEQLAYEVSNGIDPGNVENYVRHAYDMDAMIGRGRPVLLSQKSGGGGGVSTSFKKQRTFDTYADAIAAGFKPKNFDVADLVQSRITMGERLVNRTQWSKSLSGIKDPAEGTPIVTSLVTQKPKGTQVAPIGYQRMELMPGMPVAVHEGYVDLIDSLLAPSKIRSNPVGRAVLNTEAMLKHGLLAADTFHAGRMIYKELALTGKAKHDLGRSLLEYADKDLGAAVKAKEITLEAADWAKANRPDAEILTANGLNVGRISDALYKDVVKSIPVIGPFNKWVFDKLTRGAMMQSAIIEFNRYQRAFPDMPREKVAAIVAENVNKYYGNLGRQGIFKSATFQDLARIAFLAPQWVEAMAKTEVGSAIQLAKIPLDAARGKPFIVGTLAKGVGAGVVATLVANQLINYATRGHPTWENEEHGHQMDAFIPDVTGKGPGFFLNPLSVFAELTHDAVRYYEDDPHALKVVSRIVSNKLSPLAHAEEVLRTGKDWSGKTMDATWDRIKAAGQALAPVPIPLKSLTTTAPPPGSLQRQLFGSAGIKIEPAQTADSQLYSLARKFKDAKGIKEEAMEPSEYRGLNNALRSEDWKQAKKEFDALVSSKSEKTVRNHYMNLPNVLYTGKRRLETEFKSTLSDKQLSLYEKAAEERNALREKFVQLLTKEK